MPHGARFPWHRSFRLLDWRIFQPAPALPGSGGSGAGGFVLRDEFESTAGCTRQLERWLQETGAGFVSLRREHASRLPTYKSWLRYFAGDKYHLTWPGHEALAEGVWRVLRASLDTSQSTGAAGGTSGMAGELHAGGAHALSGPHAQCHAPPPLGPDEVLCFYWYRMGRVDARLRVDTVHRGGGGDDRAQLDGAKTRGSHLDGHGGAGRAGGSHGSGTWALRPKVGSGGALSPGEGNGKWAFELTDPIDRWWEPELRLRFRTPRTGSIVRVGFMLQCAPTASAHRRRRRRRRRRRVTC